MSSDCRTTRVTPLYLAARVAADGDPDTARVMDFHEGGRALGYRHLLELLRAKAEFRPGLSLERATDLLSDSFGGRTQTSGG